MIDARYSISEHIQLHFFTFYLTQSTSHMRNGDNKLSQVSSQTQLQLGTGKDKKLTALL